MTDEQIARLERTLMQRLDGFEDRQAAWRADFDARQTAWRADLEARQDRQAADLESNLVRQAADLAAWRADLEASQSRHAAALEASQAAWRADFGARQQARDVELDAKLATLATKTELDEGLRQTNAKIENVDREVKGVADGVVRLGERVEKLETLPDRMDRVEIRLEAIEGHLVGNVEMRLQTIETYVRNGTASRPKPKRRLKSTRAKR